jgi:hypothetical protein
MKTVLISMLLSFISFNSIAQDSCACCLEENNQFNFWVGEWEVFDTSNNKIGENTITLQEDNCLLKEQWTGASKVTGQSMNYYTQKDSSWNQVWVDNVGSSLVLKGRKVENRMIMVSNLIPGKKIDYYANKITWTDNSDGSVTQQWDIIDKEGNILKTLFVGIYKKK